MRPSVLLLLAGVLSTTCSVDGARVFRHSWDTVGDLMGMHGQGGSAVQSSLEFAASHYGMVTTAAPCGKQGEGTTTIEDGTLALVRQTASLCPPR